VTEAQGIVAVTAEVRGTVEALLATLSSHLVTHISHWSMKAVVALLLSNQARFSSTTN
jgi:hypothetical protein